MKILTVDIGTGTQDIFLYDSRLDIENGFKLVLPSPTMMIHRRVKQALLSRTPLLLTGHQMGGGPSSWAIEEAIRAGIPVYMTPSTAVTLNDELDKETRNVVAAFQMKYRPANFDGSPDAETAALLDVLNSPTGNNK